MRRRLLRGIVLSGLGTGSVAVVALVRNYVIAGVMGPAAFGFWNLCLIAIRLAGESHLGAVDALVRDGPIHRGAGRVAESRRLERNALGIAVLFALVGGVVAGLLIRWRGGPALVVAAALLCFTMVVQQWFLADAALLRARGRFGSMTILQVTFAAVHLVGLLLLVPRHYLSGALAAWLVGGAAAILLVRRFVARDMPMPRRSALAAAPALVKRGASTWLIAITFLLLLQVDRLAVYLMLGEESLGIYGILAIAGSAMLFLPDVVTGILWPLVGERYGGSGEDLGMMAPVVEMVLLALAPVVAAVMLFAVQATEVLLQVDPRFGQYAAALPALRIHLLGIYAVCLAMPLRYLLVTVHQDRTVLRVQATVLLLTAMATVAAAASGAGIRGVAMAAASGGVLLLVSILACALRLLRPAPRPGVLVGAALGPLALAFLVDVGLSWAMPRFGEVAGPLVRLAASGILVLLCAGMVVAVRLGESPLAAGADAGGDGRED